MDKDLKNRTLAELTELVASLGGRSYWGRYLFSFIHAKQAASLAEISPLPKAFREQLSSAGYRIDGLSVVETFADPDGTVKYLLETPTRERLEAVCLSDDGRNTLCISCQAGCRMGCHFCATGQLPYRGNLSAGQIVDQVYRAVVSGRSIHNVVFMGMGEPFDNTDAVLRAVRLFNDPNGLNLGQRHITISTCGIPEGMDRLAREALQVRLAVSLHAPDDDLRTRLMPINRRYSLAEVIAAIQRYQQHTRRRVTVEYCMIDKVNDRPEHARALAQCLRGLKLHVNLIEFNGFPGCAFVPSDGATLERFAAVLRRAGLETVIRYRRGRAIQAACGQLGAAWLTPH